MRHEVLWYHIASKHYVLREPYICNEISSEFYSFSRTIRKINQVVKVSFVFSFKFLKNACACALFQLFWRGQNFFISPMEILTLKTIQKRVPYHSRAKIKNQFTDPTDPPPIHLIQQKFRVYPKFRTMILYRFPTPPKTVGSFHVSER